VKMKKEEVEFSNCYTIDFNQNSKVHALVTWFDTPFSKLTKPTVLTTSPFA